MGSNIEAIVEYIKRYYAWILTSSALPGLNALLNSDAVLPQQQALLAIVTPLICAATVAYCVFLRDVLIRVIRLESGAVTLRVPVATRIAPAFFLIMAAICGWKYLDYLYQANADAKYGNLNKCLSPAIAFPYSIGLIGLYVGFFAALEAAFSIFLLKEYFQDKLDLSDEQLIILNSKSNESM